MYCGCQMEQDAEAGKAMFDGRDDLIENMKCYSPYKGHDDKRYFCD